MMALKIPAFLLCLVFAALLLSLSSAATVPVYLRAINSTFIAPMEPITTGGLANVSLTGGYVCTNELTNANKDPKGLNVIPKPTKGFVEFPFSVSSPMFVAISMYIHAADSMANSLWVQVNNGKPLLWDTPETSTTAPWTWATVTTAATGGKDTCLYYPTAGNYTVRLFIREPGVCMELASITQAPKLSIASIQGCSTSGCHPEGNMPISIRVPAFCGPSAIPYSNITIAGNRCGNLSWVQDTLSLQCVLPALDTTSTQYDAEIIIQQGDMQVKGTLRYAPYPVIEPPAAAKDMTIPIAAGAGGGGGALILLIGLFAWYSTRNRRKLAKLFAADVVVEQCSEAIAKMDFGAVQFLRSHPNPNRVLKSLIRIVDLLEELKPYVPDVVLSTLQRAANQAEGGVDAEPSFAAENKEDDPTTVRKPSGVGLIVPSSHNRASPAGVDQYGRAKSLASSLGLTSKSRSAASINPRGQNRAEGSVENSTSRSGRESTDGGESSHGDDQTSDGAGRVSMEEGASRSHRGGAEEKPTMGSKLMRRLSRTSSGTSGATQHSSRNKGAAAVGGRGVLGKQTNWTTKSMGVMIIRFTFVTTQPVPQVPSLSCVSVGSDDENDVLKVEEKRLAVPQSTDGRKPSSVPSTCGLTVETSRTHSSTDSGNPAEVPIKELSTAYHAFLEAVVEPIKKAKGVIQDCLPNMLIATWGAIDSSSSTNPRAAMCECSLQIRQQLEIVNQKRGAVGERLIGLSVAMHYGGGGIVGSVITPSLAKCMVMGELFCVAEEVAALPTPTLYVTHAIQRDYNISYSFKVVDVVRLSNCSSSSASKWPGLALRGPNVRPTLFLVFELVSSRKKTSDQNEWVFAVGNDGPGGGNPGEGFEDRLLSAVHHYNEGQIGNCKAECERVLQQDRANPCAKKILEFTQNV